MSQQPVDIERRQTVNEAEMARKVQNAIAIGTFPQSTTPEQVVALARVAAAYGLDPLMQELIPYQGRPFITIAGRRRLDNTAGYRPSIKFRFLTEDETAGYKSAGALADGDLVQICILTESDGRSVEGFGRSLESEKSGNAQTPQVMRRIEMCQKRAERRAREMAYGPVPMPAGLNVQVMEEGDEVTTVEGTARVVDEDTGEIPVFLDSQECFNRAIEQGRLSADEEEQHFAGDYMYMGTWGGVDTFKHRDTREYLPAPEPTAEDIADAELGQAGQNIAPPIEPPPKPAPKAGKQPKLVEEPDTGDLFPVQH